MLRLHFINYFFSSHITLNFIIIMLLTSRIHTKKAFSYFISLSKNWVKKRQKNKESKKVFYCFYFCISDKKNNNIYASSKKENIYSMILFLNVYFILNLISFKVLIVSRFLSWKIQWDTLISLVKSSFYRKWSCLVRLGRRIARILATRRQIVLE